jgi:hypothetical protein
MQLPTGATLLDFANVRIVSAKCSGAANRILTW